MYTQFFGNYLLSKGVVSQEQLIVAMQKQAKEKIKLGTLAIHAGYMTADEVDLTVIQQTHEDKRFGEIAIELGYLTNQQVIELLKSQSPSFLLLGQILVDDGVLTNTLLQKLITDYRSENELLELEMTVDSRKEVARLFENYFIASETEMSSFNQKYCELLFNNMIRFVGDDFTALPIEECDIFPTQCCVSQSVCGEYQVTSYLTMEESVAIEIAKRYVEEDFSSYDEYVQASLEDFLNLHNGLFIVNISNESSLELTISAPEQITDPVLEFNNTKAFHLPVLFSFGLVHFILEVTKDHN